MKTYVNPDIAGVRLGYAFTQTLVHLSHNGNLVMCGFSDPSTANLHAERICELLAKEIKK